MSSQREVYTSPPRTPPSQTSTAKYRPKRGYARPSIREAFPDAAVDAPRASESGEDRDPHDLSLSPNHAARTSIVDNMLLSLDQFGAPDSMLDDYRLFNSAFETEMNGRYRGHTFSSSSVSSEADYGFEDGSGRYATITATKGRRSNSSSNYQTGTMPRRVSSARSRDAVGSRSGTMPRTGDVRKGSKGSKGSSSDYTYTVPRGRADSGGVSRRSESFDCGPQKYNIWAEPSIAQDSLLYDDDAAPTPSVPAGPRRIPDYGRTPTAAASRTPVASRRNSMKSNHAPPPQVRKARPDNIGTGALKMRDSDYHLHGDADLDPPPAIPASLDPPAPSPTISYNKPVFPQPEPTATVTTTTISANLNTSSNASTKERPGFFRRVFGSGKAASPSPAESSSNVNDLSYLQDSEIKDSTGATANLKLRKEQPPKSSAGTPTKRDGPPQVVKQKSSFFRRRKKSVTDSNIPPPIVLPQELAPHMMDSMKPEPSPVSSLRQVMNPYLDSAPGNREAKENRDGQAQARESVSLQAQRPRESVSAPGGNPKATQQNLQPPRSVRSPPVDGRGANDHTPRAGEVEPTASSNSPLQVKSSNAAPAALSPVVEDFSRNLTVSTKVASADASRDSLAETSKLAIPSDSNVPESPAASETSHYQTAFNTPVIETEEPEAIVDAEDKMDGPGEAIEDGATPTDREQAQKLFDNQDQVGGTEPAAAWLGDPDRATIREAYMRLFNWSNFNILAALRSLCERLVLKGETQQVDRVLDAFSSRWCDCNPSHGFKATGKLDLSISLTRILL